MSDRKYFVICEQGCRFESMTKEQIMTAITQAVNEGTVSDIDSGFISRVKTINGGVLRFFVGTQSEYEMLSAEQKTNLLAVITNETLVDDMIAEIKRQLSSGDITIEHAETASSLDLNEIYFAEIKGNNTLVIGSNGVQALTAGRTYTISASDENERFSYILYIPSDYKSGSIVHSTQGSWGGEFQWKDGMLCFCDSDGRYSTVSNVTIREI